MSKPKLAFRDNPQWNDFQLNNALSFYWQVLASLCLSVCSHQPCYFLLCKKANSRQIFSADKSIHFYTFWCFIFREVHMERLGMKPDVLEVIPRAAASCALTTTLNKYFQMASSLILVCWAGFRREMAHDLLLPCAIALCSDPRMEESLRKVSVGEDTGILKVWL